MLLNQALAGRQLTIADQRLLSTLRSALRTVTDHSQHPEIIDRAIARLSPVNKAKKNSRKGR
jgi:hypothetical protein